MNGNRVTGLPTGLTGSGSDAISRAQALMLVRAGTCDKAFGIFYVEKLCGVRSHVIN